MHIAFPVNNGIRVMEGILHNVSSFTRILLNNYINNGFVNLQKSKKCFFFVSENYRGGPRNSLMHTQRDYVFFKVVKHVHHRNVIFVRYGTHITTQKRL